jgi:hypothetical protein
MTIVGETGADDVDNRLHEERRTNHQEPLDALPDGAFVLRDGEPWLVKGGELLRWTPSGYTDRVPMRRGEATVVTPPSLLGVLRAGWLGAVPLFHESA